MRLIIGILVVCGCVVGGYLGVGGHMAVLWQPFEFIIILGAAIGAFLIGNTGPIIKGTLGSFGTMFKGPKYNKAAYVELLGMQFSMYKLIQSKGILALEQHIENPHDSTLFNRFPKFAGNQP
jgi:chemotaxis protein MotA